MGNSRRSAGLILGSLLVLALALVLSAQVFAQDGRAPWASSADSAGEGALLSPPDGLTINPTLPEIQKPLQAVSPAGASSSAILPAGLGAAEISLPDQLTINPNLPEVLTGPARQPAGGAESSAVLGWRGQD